jgi:hypothetical protein
LFGQRASLCFVTFRVVEHCFDWRFEYLASELAFAALKLYI